MKRTDLDKQVHSLRNITFAMQGGLDAIASVRDNAEDFTRIREAMAEQLRALKGVVAEVDRIAEEARSNAAPGNDPGNGR